MTTKAKVRVCTTINLLLLATVWVAIVVLPNIIWPIPIWGSVILAIAGLVVAGYFVGWVLSPLVTRMVCGPIN